jgi:hypothetical protein
MADTRTWAGSDGDWSVAGNWSPVGVPVDGDTAILNGTNDVAIIAGLNQAAVKLALLFIADDFTKDVGLSGTRLQIEASLIIHRGKGAFYHDGGAVAQNEVVIISHTGDRTDVAYDYDGLAPVRLVVSRGRVVVDATAGGAMTDLVVSYVASREADSDVTYTGSVGGITNALIAGGVFAMEPENSPIDNLVVHGAKATMEMVIPTLSPTIHIAHGGVVNWDVTSVVLTEANIYDGLLDLTQSHEEKTVTLANLWPRGEFRFFPDLTTETTKEWDGRTVDIG